MSGFSLPLSNPHVARNRHSVLLSIVAVEGAILCLPPKWLGFAGLTLVLLVALLTTIVFVITGRKHVLIVAWVVAFPLGYYWLSFPREHSVITLDRVFIILLLLAAAVFSKNRVTWQIPAAMRGSAVCWSIFLFFALFTILRSSTSLGALRLWLDVFVLPGILAWYVLRYINVRRCASALHIAVSVMTIYVAGIGAAEVALQRDLLALPEGGVVVAGDYDAAPDNLAAQIFIRPNGPFATVNSFAMVGVVSLFFLLFLRQAIANDMPAWQRILHRVSVAAAVAESLMPLYKSVLISFLVILLIDTFYQQRRKALRIGLMAGAGVGVLFFAVALPDVFSERADPLTFYARLAQEKQTLGLFISHPIIGVGLNNFHAVAEKTPLTYYSTGEALDYPHNNLGAILAETGVSGFLPFVASQFLLLSAFWNIKCLNSEDSKLAWRTFLFIFLCFWINGMALTIIYFQDLNLWYMFVLAFLYKFAHTTVGSEAPKRLQ